jgi:glycosyltransferase involved in cell wall biosynthesis
MSERKGLKITLLAHDIGANLMRARSIASILVKNYEVELVTIVPPGSKETVADYFGDLPVTCHNIAASHYPHFLETVREVRRAISGDVIYALKLRPGSFGVALLERLKKDRRPVLLDVDDWERFMCYPYSKYWVKNVAKSLRLVADPNSYIHTWLVEFFARQADNVTNVSQFFQRRYGGVLLPNGCDTDRFNPDNFNRQSLRQEWGIDKYKVIMFLGTADPYKGASEIAQALQLLKRPDLRLVIVGRHNEFVDQLLAQYSNVFYWGMHPPTKSPEFLRMADLVVLPQANLPHAAGQMPMKMFEAMAMELPVIATPMADIKEVLKGGGRVAESNRPEDIATQIEWVLAHPNESRAMGQAARQRCEQFYSWNAMGRVLDQVLAPYNSADGGYFDPSSIQDNYDLSVI